MYLFSTRVAFDTNIVQYVILFCRKEQFLINADDSLVLENISLIYMPTHEFLQLLTIIVLWIHA